MKDQSKFAKKSLGQNFLTSTTVRDNILKEAGDLRGKHVLEIGPGLGFLTEKLLESGAILTAVELDNRAYKILQKLFGDHPNFTLINGDILQQDLDAMYAPPLSGVAGRGAKPHQSTPSNSPSKGENASTYCVIANFPYNITGPILRKLLEKTANKPEFTLLMVQKEVAHKICDPVACTSPLLGETERGASTEKSEVNKILSIPLQGTPGANPKSKIQNLKSPRRSILSISVEVYATAKYCFTVGREHFEPAPKVDSAIMKLTTLKKPLITNEQQRDFFTVVNAGFSEKRKKIGNVLGKFFGIGSDKLLGAIDGNRRAETLSVSEWVAVTERFRKIDK